MKKTFLIIGILAITASLSAKQYPDSVREASREEANIAYGWNFEFGGGLGVGSYLFSQMGSGYTPAHVVNKVQFPAWHAEVGINYYFVPWMGIGTGAQFSAYPNRAAIENPWVKNANDIYGDAYTLTSVPNSLTENQNIYMLEIPLALKFRARPGVVGFTGTAGVKIGLPMINNNRLTDGTIANTVHYPFYDLTMSHVPTVVEDLSIAGSSTSLSTSRFRTLNYAAYAELGMLIRLHQRVELAIAAYANYYFTDLLEIHGSNELGFYDGRSVGEYPTAYAASYDGVLRTTEVQELHPWSVGLKIGLQINANRTKAQRDYDREQRRLRKVAQEEEPAEEPVEEPIAVEEPVVVAVVDTIPEEPVDTTPDPIELIRRIAEANNIDICAVFCPEPEPEPEPPVTNAVAAELEEELKKAVIYFDYDKAVPILEPKDILVRIAEVLKRHPQQKIHVNGHTCKLGKPDYNKRLALRRANAVADQLRALGVHDDQMLIASLGADVPYRYGVKHPYAKDRRVEIVPTYRTTEVVRPGSRLAQIARRHYGNPDFWVFIYEANRDKITDPQNLPAGIELEIPDLSDRLKGMTEKEVADEALQLKKQLMKE